MHTHQYKPPPHTLHTGFQQGHHLCVQQVLQPAPTSWVSEQGAQGTGMYFSDLTFCPAQWECKSTTLLRRLTKAPSTIVQTATPCACAATTSGQATPWTTCVDCLALPLHAPTGLYTLLLVIKCNALTPCACAATQTDTGCCKNH